MSKSESPNAANPFSAWASLVTGLSSANRPAASAKTDAVPRPKRSASGVARHVRSIMDSNPFSERAVDVYRTCEAFRNVFLSMRGESGLRDDYREFASRWNGGTFPQSRGTGLEFPETVQGLARNLGLPDASGKTLRIFFFQAVSRDAAAEDEDVPAAAKPRRRAKAVPVPASEKPRGRKPSAPAPAAQSGDAPDAAELRSLESEMRSELGFAAVSSRNFYGKTIQSHPLLSSEEMNALIGKMREGDARALDRIVSANIRLAIFVANKFSRGRKPLEDDLIQEGIF